MTKTNTLPRKEKSDAAEQTSAPEPGSSGLSERTQLAEMISAVLRHPKLPVRLYDAIMHGFDDIWNDSYAEEQQRVETSVEQILSRLEMECPDK